MKLAILQTNPHLGNYTANIDGIKNFFQKHHIPTDVKDVLCLTSSFALCGNPWQSIKDIPAFTSRMQENSAKLLENKYHVLAQSFLSTEVSNKEDTGQFAIEKNTRCASPIKPIWQHQGKNTTSTYTEDFFTIDSHGFFAPHNLDLEDLENLEIPENTNIIYLACAHQFYEGIEECIENALTILAKRANLPVVYINTVGATDGTVFAGQSMLIDATGKVLARLKNFEEECFLFDLDFTEVHCEPKINETLDSDGALFCAASLAIKDYAKKCNIKHAVIGISGGMDSALIASLTCEALGAQNVTGIMMPSKFSSDGSVIDATKLLGNLGINYHTIPISDIINAYEKTLTPPFNTLTPLANPENDLTIDNLQARTRGNLLMAFANRLGAMVIGTGNKSEAAMGYCTLYGDTVGALEPISDIYKTRVYSVAKWYNTWKNKEIIPQNIFDKAPSAELRPGQKDEDTLPPYPLLDRVLEQIMEKGIDPQAVSDPEMSDVTKTLILSRLALSEFKRQQSPFVVSLSARAFGQHWAPPISAKAF